MLGLGWTEMLVIGLVALIVIGPKDLPVVMSKIGKFAGQIRRMGAEFQREINKTTGLDEVRNLRNSITEPLRKTSEEIRREFNTITPTGVKPSGVIKPADPKAESVVKEIEAAAGITSPTVADTANPVMTATPAKPVPAAKPVKARKAPVKATAAPTSPVTTADLAPIGEEPAPKKAAPRKVAAKPAADGAVKATPARKPAAKKAPAKLADTAEAAVKPVRAKRTPAKPKAAAPDQTGEA